MKAKAVLDKNMPEKAFQALVIDYARRMGWLVHHCRPSLNQKGEWRTHLQGDAGFPDLVMARKGSVIFAELKREGEVLSEKQSRWKVHLKPDVFGRHWYLWCPSDWELIKEILR